MDGKAALDLLRIAASNVRVAELIVQGIKDQCRPQSSAYYWLDDLIGILQSAYQETSSGNAEYWIKEDWQADGDA